MQRIRIWLWRFPVFLAIIAAAWLPQLAGAHDTRSYAYAQLTSTGYRGVYGEIETANPQIRDGGFSAEAIWIGGSTSYAEVGRRKESWMGEPEFYYAYWDSPGSFQGPYWMGTPGVGSRHLYEINHAAGNSGGVSKFGDANAMGVPEHLYLMYRDAAGNWYYYNGWNQEHVDPGYYLARLSDKAYQTGGNN